MEHGEGLSGSPFPRQLPRPRFTTGDQIRAQGGIIQ